LSRRGVVDLIGFFVCVRYGADSEYWFRLRRHYGQGGLQTRPLCLGFGHVRPDSLTQSGSGAMDRENYSPIRGAYNASYLQWHSTTAPADLKLPPRAGARPFWAPPEMAVPGAQEEDASFSAFPAPAASVPEFMFGISLASKGASADWGRTQELLGHTLRSLLNQSDPRFSVVICGHERPDLPELADPRFLFTKCDRRPPMRSDGFRADKMRKRRLIASVLRKRGGGYFFPLDADDLVHRDVVAHTLSDDNRKGYLIDRGYALDYGSGILAPIPGAWSVPFDRVCGSSAVIFFRPEELPTGGDIDKDLYFNLFQSHAYWPIVAEEFDRSFTSFPFAGGIYVVNHAQNLSFRLQRAGVRTANIIDAISRNALSGKDETLESEFGWRSDVSGAARRSGRGR
jgi:hypothetical protein